MQSAWSYIIVGVVLLIIGLALMNIPFGFEGGNIVSILGWVLLIIGIILIVVGILYFLRARVP